MWRLKVGRKTSLQREKRIVDFSERRGEYLREDRFDQQRLGFVSLPEEMDGRDSLLSDDEKTFSRNAKKAETSTDANSFVNLGRTRHS